MSDVQPHADGTVTARLNGQPVRVRPDFAVTRSPAGAPRAITVEGGQRFFDTGDGHRQRFTVVP